jgi:hypothetical protein
MSLLPVVLLKPALPPEKVLPELQMIVDEVNRHLSGGAAFLISRRFLTRFSVIC